MPLYPVEQVVDYIYTNAKPSSQLFIFEHTIFEGNKYTAFISCISHYLPVNAHKDVIKSELHKELSSICTYNINATNLDRSTTLEKYVDIIIETVLCHFEPYTLDEPIKWSDENEKLTEENRKLKEHVKTLTEEIAVQIAINKKKR
jgi:hypothetical protein